MTSDPPDDIGRRELLSSVATIGVSSMIAGAGTASLFADRETARSPVAAGTLDLQAGLQTNRTIRIEDVDGGDSGLETLALENVGSIAGHLGVTPTLSTASCDTEDDNKAEDRACEWEPDRDNAEGEKSQADTGNSKRLGDTLHVEIGFDRDGSGGGDDATVAVQSTPVADLPFGEEQSTDHTLTADGSDTDSTQLYVAWYVDDSYEPTNNDGIAFSVAVNLTQL